MRILGLVRTGHREISVKVVGLLQYGGFAKEVIFVLSVEVLAIR